MATSSFPLHSQSFEELFTSNYQALFQLGFGMCHNRELVKDAIQSFFVKLWEKEIWLKEIDNPKAYLFRAFYRHMLKALTAKDRLNHLSDVLPEAAIPPYETLLIEVQEQAVFQSRLQDAISQLPPQMRRVLELRFQEGLPYDEIAENTGKSKQTVYNQIHTAVAKLRKMLS